MSKIAALVPTYHRAHKLAAFIKNHNSSSTESTLYFIVTSEDVESQEEIKRLGERVIVSDGEYVSAINRGFKDTTEPFVLCGADDIVFSDGWDTELLKHRDDSTKHIFGGIDEWVISRTMKHISHPLIRRARFADLENLYNPEYAHYMCDIEFVQRGWQKEEVLVLPKLLIGHPHTIIDGEIPEKWDATYQRSFAKIQKDKDLYDRRKAQFEVWDFDELQQGRVIPTQVNPEYAKTLVSIVIPSYNDADFLKLCLRSVSANTYYRYEIIIINNGSDPIQKTKTPWDLIDTKVFFDSLSLEDTSCELKVINWQKNVWCNPTWNYGVSIAKGQYVAIINSDIEVSKHWDKYLVAALENPTRKFTISCPFETNPNRSKRFALDEWFMKHVPYMIKGPCFMFRKSDVPKMFPIPEQMKHWCGDNWLADKANAMWGVVYAKTAQIYHYGSQATKRQNLSKVSERTFKDVLAYEKITGKNMDWLKSTFPPVIQEYCQADGDEYKSPR